MIPFGVLIALLLVAIAFLPHPLPDHVFFWFRPLGAFHPQCRRPRLHLEGVVRDRFAWARRRP